MFKYLLIVAAVLFYSGLNAATCPTNDVWAGTVNDGSGNFASRTLVTFSGTSASGTVLVSDSSQMGLKKVFSPFGVSQGYYTCDGTTLRITAYNFQYPDDITTQNQGDSGKNKFTQGIVRQENKLIGSGSDWTGTIQLDTFSLQGNLNGAPDSSFLSPFTLTLSRITPVFAP